MKKRIIFIILPAILSLGSLFSCGGSPTPTPEPEPTPSYPIDFDFNPSSDDNITVKKGETRQVNIHFKDSSYYSNKSKVEWSVHTESSTYISKDSEADDGMWCKFKAEEITPEDTPAMLTVKVTSKSGNVKEKTCHITVEDPYPIDFDFNPTTDKDVSIGKDSQKQIKIAFKDSSYSQNYKSIEWTIDSTSATYISKVEESADHVTYTFKANNITPSGTYALLKVKVTSLSDKVIEKTCQITVTDPYPIDFDFNPTTDKDVSIGKDSQKQIKIAFKDPSYSQNYKTIEWTIDSTSATYISKVEESADHVTYTFKANNITPSGTYALLKVKVTSLSDKVIEKTCQITVTDPYPIDFDFNPTTDSNVTIDKGEQKNLTIAFKDPSYSQNYKSIDWAIEKGSNNISIVGETSDPMTRTIQADKITTEPAVVNITVTSKSDKTITKKCNITVISRIKENLIYSYESAFSEGYYSYKQEGNVAANTSFVFTATHNGTNIMRYFGMSKYDGSTPYFTIGYKDSTKKLNITKVSLYDGSTTTELTVGKELSIYSQAYLIFDKTLVKTNYQIIFECTITEALTEGLWAYVGNY